MAELYRFPAPNTPIPPGALWEMFVRAVQQSGGGLDLEEIAAFFRESYQFLLRHSAAVSDFAATMEAQYTFCREFFTRYSGNEELMRALGSREDVMPLITGAVIAASKLSRDMEFVALMRSLSEKYGFAFPGMGDDGAPVDESSHGIQAVVEAIRIACLNKRRPCTLVAVRREDFERDKSLRLVRSGELTQERLHEAEDDIVEGVIYALRKTGFLLVLRGGPVRPVVSGYVSKDGDIRPLRGDALAHSCERFLPQFCGVREWECSDQLVSST